MHRIRVVLTCLLTVGLLGSFSPVRAGVTFRVGTVSAQPGQRDVTVPVTVATDREV